MHPTDTEDPVLLGAVSILSTGRKVSVMLALTVPALKTKSYTKAVCLHHTQPLRLLREPLQQDSRDTSKHTATCALWEMQLSQVTVEESINSSLVVYSKTISKVHNAHHYTSPESLFCKEKHQPPSSLQSVITGRMCLGAIS